MEVLLRRGTKLDADSLADQAEFLGIDMDKINASITHDDVIEIWPEHEAAVSMFILCQTQWRSTGLGLIGLDYNVVFLMMDMYNVADRATVLEDLQAMEIKAIEILNKRAEVH